MKKPLLNLCSVYSPDVHCSAAVRTQAWGQNSRLVLGGGELVWTSGLSNRLSGMVSWVEETLGDEDGGQKDNSALWQTDNPLWHLPSNCRKCGEFLQGHSVL